MKREVLMSKPLLRCWETSQDLHSGTSAPNILPKSISTIMTRPTASLLSTYIGFATRLYPLNPSTQPHRTFMVLHTPTILHQNSITISHNVHTLPLTRPSPSSHSIVTPKTSKRVIYRRLREITTLSGVAKVDHDQSKTSKKVLIMIRPTFDPSQGRRDSMSMVVNLALKCH